MSLEDWLKDVFVGPKEPGGDRFLSYFGMVVWGLVVAALGAALFSAIVNLWPIVDVAPPTDDGSTTETQEARSVAFLWGAFSLDLTKTTGLIVLAIVAGALGGWASATRLFAFWVGQRKLKSTWAWWFGNRVLGGAALALIVYLVIRAGLTGTEGSTDDVNAYGTAAFSALVGLFTRQAMTKIQGVFDSLFQTGEEADGESAELDQGEPAPEDVEASHRPSPGTGPSRGR